MSTSSRRLVVVAALFATVSAFAPPSVVPRPITDLAAVEEGASASAGQQEQNDVLSGRRTFLQQSAAATLLMPALSSSIILSSQPQPALAATTTEPKVLVLGGTGFVGSRVVQQLQAQGVSVTATSRDGRDGTVALDVTKTADVAKEIENMVRGIGGGGGGTYTAVISCIGSIGSPNDGVVNAASGLAAQGAKAAGVERFVYIGVAPEVKELAKGISFLDDYMKGKTFSQSAIVSSFPSSATLIEPTFIYGGDSFSASPPRVASFYGEFIESLLSSGPVRGITNIAPEGIVKIALEPPVSVDAVAAAAVQGALGQAKGGVLELDTYDKIKAAAAAGSLY